MYSGWCYFQSILSLKGKKRNKAYNFTNHLKVSAQVLSIFSGKTDDSLKH